MIDPIFWLVISFVLVSVSLTAVMVVLVPAVRELSRAARSVEKLCDTINRDLPSTLESIRLTSQEIAHLTDDVNAGVHNATQAAQQVNQSVSSVRTQAKRAEIGTRSLMAGMNAALITFLKSEEPRDRRRSSPQPTSAKRTAAQRIVPTPAEPSQPSSQAGERSPQTDKEARSATSASSPRNPQVSPETAHPTELPASPQKSPVDSTDA